MSKHHRSFREIKAMSVGELSPPTATKLELLQSELQKIEASQVND